MESRAGQAGLHQCYEQSFLPEAVPRIGIEFSIHFSVSFFNPLRLRPGVKRSSLITLPA
jgi:hypothetical protein